MITVYLVRSLYSYPKKLTKEAYKNGTGVANPQIKKEIVYSAKKKRKKKFV